MASGEKHYSDPALKDRILPLDPGPPYLYGASEDLARAYIETANAAKQTRKASRRVRVEGYSLTVGIRKLEDAEKYGRPYLGMVDYQIVTRVDVLAAERLGLETRRSELDLWVAKQEAGIDCLFWPWRDYLPPFPAADWHFAHDGTIAPGDAWAEHIQTKGRFRLYFSTVGPHYEQILGGSRR